MSHHTNVIRSVRLTEKASVLSDGFNKYVFEVAAFANKVQIRDAVERFYGKKVISVNTCNYSGKLRRRRTSSSGRASSWKKAIVTLASGERLEFA